MDPTIKIHKAGVDPTIYIKSKRKVVVRKEIYTWTRQLKFGEGRSGWGWDQDRRWSKASPAKISTAKIVCQWRFPSPGPPPPGSSSLSSSLAPFVLLSSISPSRRSSPFLSTLIFSLLTLPNLSITVDISNYWLFNYRIEIHFSSSSSGLIGFLLFCFCFCY